MGLISCPVCAKAISAEAPTCPNCGHPIAKRQTDKPSHSIIIHNSRRSPIISAFVGLILLAGMFVFLLALTKPSESDLRKALQEKYGIVYGVGEVAEKIGLVNFQYNDYVVFSSLSTTIPGDVERTLVFGFLGKTMVPDAPLSFESGRTSRPSIDKSSNNKEIVETNVEELTTDVPPIPTTHIPANSSKTTYTDHVYSEEQMLQGLQHARQLLIANEMRQKATDTFTSRHPLSRIEQCDEPNVQSFNQSLFGEEIVAIYPCHMRGKITGKNLFFVTVRVRGTITFSDGIFIRRVVSADILVDNRVK